MSKDKYPGIFSRQMETTVFIILQIFFASPSVLKIGEILGCSPILAGKSNIRSRDAFISNARERNLDI